MFFTVVYALRNWLSNEPVVCMWFAWKPTLWFSTPYPDLKLLSHSPSYRIPVQVSSTPYPLLLSFFHSPR